MQNTTNYNMNLVEGTDIVNIPVQLNPNFQTVDAEMFKNKQAGVGTATEVVTGTVHAIVRANVDADMFRFTATGAWTAGDTMTLDGSAVTVHLTDGTAPATGAYIIGAEVVAVVNGTLVTLLTSNGAVDPGVTSFNSRTGAVTPAASDYDASMIDYDNTGSGLTATDVQSALDELASTGANLHYALKATAAANDTYANQLTYLEPFYNALSTDERMRSVLLVGDTTILRAARISLKEFSLNIMSGTHIFGFFARLDSQMYKTSQDTTVTDMSTDTNTGTIKLLVLEA